MRIRKLYRYLCFHYILYCMNILFFVSCLGQKQLFACDLCSVQTSSPVDLQTHFHGKRHKAIAARQMVKDESIPKIQIRSRHRRNCSLGSQCCWCHILTEIGHTVCSTVEPYQDYDLLRLRFLFRLWKSFGLWLRFQIQTIFSTIFQQQKFIRTKSCLCFQSWPLIF